MARAHRTDRIDRIDPAGLRRVVTDLEVLMGDLDLRIAVAALNAGERRRMTVSR